MERKKKRPERLNFRGLSFEEAVSAAVRVKPPKRKQKKRAKAKRSA